MPPPLLLAAGVVRALPVWAALLLPVVRLLQLVLQPHRLPLLQQGLPQGLPKVHPQVKDSSLKVNKHHVIHLLREALSIKNLISYYCTGLH